MFANRLRKINSTAVPAPARAHGGPGAVGIEYDSATQQLVIADDNPGTAANRRLIPTTVAQAGATAKQILVFTAVFNPASVATITTAEQPATVAGVLATDTAVAVIKPTLTAGVGIVNARVSAANTVQVTFVNPTAAPVDPPSETYTFVVAR